MTSNTPSATASASSGGIGFFGLLTITLLVLKVTGYLNISWWIVFAPILFGIAFVILFFAVIIGVGLIIALRK